MDFLLKEEQVVEAKMTRTGLGAKEVSEQLIIDAAKYREHQDCKTLVCLVYDPGGIVKNPRGIGLDRLLAAHRCANPLQRTAIRLLNTLTHRGRRI